MSAALRLAWGCLLAAGAAGAWAQAGIYTCTDAKGRRLTSDRPIPECSDREQKLLNASGTVRQTIPPTMTAPERAAHEERERKAAEERQRAAEQKRMQKLLVARYPNQTAHDAERQRAVHQVQEAIASGHRRIADLREERRKIDAETEFYKDPAKYPAKLRRQIEESDQQIAAQQRLIATQENEKQRIAQRFDAELVQLKVLWAQSAPTNAAEAPGAPIKR